MAPHSKKPQKKKKKNDSVDKPKIDKASKKIFKPKKREQNDAVVAAKSEALSLQLEDEVPDFPRGCKQSRCLFFLFFSLRILVFEFEFG